MRGLPKGAPGEGAFAFGVLAQGDLAVLVVDEDLTVSWATPAAIRLLGSSEGPLPELVEQESAATVASFFDRLDRSGGQAAQVVCKVPVRGSTPRRLELVGRDLRRSPEIGGFLVVAHDVTGWAERETAFQGRLTSDELTGLGNRASLMDRLGQAVRTSPVAGPRAAVLFADLDSFKLVNDRYGHEVGDLVLRVVGSRVLAAVDERGSVYRMGGDEFVVLLDRVDEDEAAELGEVILATLGQPIDVAAEVGDKSAGGNKGEQGGNKGAYPASVRVTASVGIAMADAGRRSEDLMRGADMAMYRAKGAGRNRVEFYTPDLNDWVLARKKSVETLAVQVEQLRNENRALAEAASTDYRTGLANTATFDADHTQLHARLVRSAEPYSVLLVDIDHFHDYNTAYGYLKGNETLRRTATTIASAVRQADKAYRYGGEEFAAILPGTTLDGAEVVAERVRHAVESLRLEHATNPTGFVTVTVGVIEARPEYAKPDEVFEMVNALLLAGKDAGRNRVVSPRDVDGGSRCRS